MNDDRLTKLVFLWDLEKSNNQNWSHHDDVKRLLQFLDMSTWFFFKSWGLQPKLSQKFVNYWLNELQRVSKYRAYMSFRIDFRLEKYVTKDISKPYWSVLAQLRRAVLPIRKETVAIQGEGVNDRLCTMCSVIKNEFDFNCTVHLIQTLESNFTCVLLLTIDYLACQTQIALVFSQTVKLLCSDNLSYLNLAMRKTFIHVLMFIKWHISPMGRVVSSLCYHIIYI